MRIGIDSFRGEAPRLTPRALPDNGAQNATNARLLTGDLEAWRQFASEQVLSNTGPVQTIYKLSDLWLAWDTDVDVARAVVAGDTTFRTFLTGPDEYTRPQWTNYAMAGAGGGPPTTTRPLGVPGPDTPPGVAAGLDPNPTTFNVDVDDEGDTLNEWTVGETPGAVGYTRLVTQENSFGHPAGSYRIYAANNGSQAAYMYRNFASENCTAFKLTFDYYVQSGTGYGFMAANVQNSAAGDGLQIRWLSDVGLQIALSGSWLVPGGGSLVTDPTVNPPTDTWLTCEIEVISNSDGTQTITATIFNGSSTVGSVTTTGTFDIGGYSGLVGCVNLTSITFYDNIHAEGSGSTGYTPISTATSYAYTFVNDIGEESAPSLASTTVLRPDGVAITVSTPTDVPTGIDNGEWVIQTKRIYRAVTGATGTFYRFVAEIPLATADYVDTLADTELGEVLESELWALPPVDMKGILALPNSVMVGFSKNQLCLSAQNHPHAWPVEYRLTVDTDIVAIGAIDTTVVVATKNFIYLAIGTDPSAYSMTKLEVPQACVAKRSLAYLIGIGVVFASPDGLIAVAGNGNVRNLTSSVFTREQWQALAPESIVGIAHDDVYHFFYDTDFGRDPYFLDVVLLLHGDSIEDMSPYRHVATVPETVTVGSNTFPNSEMPGSTAIRTLGTSGSVGFGYPVNLVEFNKRSAFTLEFWVRYNGSGNIGFMTSPSGTGGAPKSMTSNGGALLSVSSEWLQGGGGTTDVTFGANEWHWVVIQANGTQYAIFIDGERRHINGPPNQDLTAAQFFLSAHLFNPTADSSIMEVRWTQDVARYDMAAVSIPVQSEPWPNR